MNNQEISNDNNYGRSVALTPNQQVWAKEYEALQQQVIVNSALSAALTLIPVGSRTDAQQKQLDSANFQWLDAERQTCDVTVNRIDALNNDQVALENKLRKH